MSGTATPTTMQHGDATLIKAPDATPTPTPAATPAATPPTATTPAPGATPAPAAATPPDDKNGGGTLVGSEPPATPDPTKPDPAKPDPAKPTELKPEDYKIEYPKEITDGAADPVIGKFLPTAAKLGLTNEQVQALINEMGPVLRADSGAAWEGLMGEWQTAFKADPQIGGQKLTETVAALNAAITAFATDQAHAAEVTKHLQITGAGNSLPIMKLFHNMASRLKEGTPVNGNGAPGPTGKDPGSLLYTHPTSQPGASPTRG